ncbi:hypothetical protein L615_008500000120 [Nocardioides sp. J9]|nr:hypothetical protein L615_008500000120 [Nocardioides sp. J9]
MSSWWFTTSSRVWKLPTATSRSPSGVMSNLRTWVTPSLWLPAITRLMKVVGAPVVGLSVARARWARPPTWVKAPPIQSRPSRSAASRTCPETVPALKVVTTWPSEIRTRATRERLWLPMLVKLPTT